MVVTWPILFLTVLLRFFEETNTENRFRTCGEKRRQWQTFSSQRKLREMCIFSSNMA